MTKNEFHDLMVRLGYFRDTTPIYLDDDDQPPENSLVIGSFAFPLPEGYPEPEWAVHNAMDALMAIMRHRPPADLVDQYHLRPIWQDWMMFILPHVAEHFGVNRYDVLSKWIKEWAPSIACGREIPIFGYTPGDPIMSQAEALKRWELCFGRDSKKDKEIRSEDSRRA